MLLEEPNALIAHVRVCGSLGRATARGHPVVDKVALPENTRVEFEPRVLEVQQADAMLKAFEILSHSYETGQPDLAARHDEHQP